MSRLLTPQSLVLLSFIFGVVPVSAAPTRWDFDSSKVPGLTLEGKSSTVKGVEKQAQSLDGHSLFTVEDSAAYAPNDPGFTLTLWVNAFAPANGEQQILAGKNVYSQNQREWGVMIDQDGLFRLYVWQGSWKTIAVTAQPKPGHWYQVGVVVQPGLAQLWLNGEKAGSLILNQPVPRTDAPLTFGGIDDGGRIRQTFFGAIDKAIYFDHPLPAATIASGFVPYGATLPIPQPSKRFALWDETASLPTAEDIADLEGVEFHVIKKWDKPADGYTFLHGVGLAWHKGKLYASFGHNKGAENTVTEEAQFRVSEDGGKSWGPLQVIDDGDEENLAVSHGVFHSHAGTLWAFHGAYYGKMQNIHTRAYSLNEETGEWKKHGTIVKDGFWAMNQPVQMDNGHWIMPGGSFGLYSNDRVFPAAVAISHGNDLTRWDMVSIPVDQEIHRMWSESSLFVDGRTVYNIARYGGGAQALIAVSHDYGRTWSSTEVSNLPMATSKPAAGTLSSGQRYLVCTTATANGGRRSPLTIAVSRPGENFFSKVFVIRRSQNPEHPGESADRLSLSYPCAIEYKNKLYVGYSNNGGRRGNLNSAELAIIPIKALEITR